MLVKLISLVWGLPPYPGHDMGNRLPVNYYFTHDCYNVYTHGMELRTCCNTYPSFKTTCTIVTIIGNK
jgi:hypothetical protein